MTNFPTPVPQARRASPFPRPVGPRRPGVCLVHGLRHDVVGYPEVVGGPHRLAYLAVAK